MQFDSSSDISLEIPAVAILHVVEYVSLNFRGFTACLSLCPSHCGS